MLSAFYPGAGTDLFPPIMFRSIKKWIYMDSLPNSACGHDHGLYFRPKFIEQLTQIMKQNGFKQKCIDDNTYTFYNQEHEQIIQYETNSIFPNSLQQHHYQFDTLVLCGFDLGDQTINFINKYSNIITNNITHHELEEEKLLLSKQVFTMIIDKDWEYWKPQNQITDLIQKNIRIGIKIK